MMKALFLTNLFLVSVFSVRASKESSQACFVAAEALNDLPSVNKPHNDLLIAYNETCREKSLCDFSIDENLLKYVSNGDINPSQLYEAVSKYPIAVSANTDFGSGFKKDPTYALYWDACEAAGGSVACVDGTMFLQGNIGGMLSTEDGADAEVVFDIEFFAKAFPICMPEVCEDEDLTTVMEDATRDAVLKIPEISENLTPTTEALLKEVTFSQLCALSGLETCKLSADTVDCAYSPSDYGYTSTSSSAGRVLSLVSGFVAVASTMYLW